MRALTNLMRSRALLGCALVSGLLSGLVLALVVYGMERLFGARVYVLLMNVDFVHWLPQPLPAWLELLFHLLVALPLAYLYLLLYTWKTRSWRFAVLFGAGVGLGVWLPLTLVSERTPDWHDLQALGLWLVAHAVYGVSLYIFARRSYLVIVHSTKTDAIRDNR